MKAKALSVRQPWAWALFHGKPVENRTWPSRYTGPLLIHASKTFDHLGYRWLLDHRGLLTGQPPHPDNYKIGGIIGKVKMVDCVGFHFSPWFFGPWGFVFEGAQELPFMACRGQLGFFGVECASEARD